MNEENANKSATCVVCNINEALYVCPRCNISYCSVTCYRGSKHLECSESFYKEQILATLSTQSEEENVEGRQSMEEILMRLHAAESKPSEELDSDDDDDEIEDELSARLTGVSLEDADAVWQRLTSSERADFEKMLQTGRITELLPAFSPWWSKKLIEEVASASENNSHDVPVSQKSTCHSKPTVIKDVTNFKNICKKSPSPSLPLNTVNIIGAYVYTVRCFNGEHIDWSSHAAYIVWSLSEVLSNNQNFNTMLDAITSVSVNMTQKENASEEDISTMKADVECIISSPPHLPVALSDLILLFRAALKHRPPTAKGPFSQRFPDGADNQLPRDKLKLTVKKLEFYLSWVLQDNNIFAIKE